MRTIECRSYDYCPQRMADETDPLRIQIVALQMAKDFGHQSVRHNFESAERSALREHISKKKKNRFVIIVVD